MLHRVPSKKVKVCMRAALAGELETKLHPLTYSGAQQLFIWMH